MKNKRIAQIAESLSGLGTNPYTLYTNQEIVNHLAELQAAMAKGVFEKTHAENLRDRDIMIHFESLAKEFGLDETDIYRRFKANMNDLGYTIGSFIKGMNGERIARRALKLLSYDKAVRILYNVQLEDDDSQAEYDAIVVAPYGLFVVEVKNWGVPMTISANGLLTRNDGSGIVYDLPGRMSVKEALLREYLQELFPTDYHNMLLLSNERAQVQDNYHRIPISCGGGISYEIKSYGKKDASITEDQVQKIADMILVNHKEQRALCSVKCKEIIADYASLMAQIEAASSEADEQSTASESFTVCKAAASNKRPWYKRVDWCSMVTGVAAVVIPSSVTTALTHRR